MWLQWPQPNKAMQVLSLRNKKNKHNLPLYLENIYPEHVFILGELTL